MRRCQLALFLSLYTLQKPCNAIGAAFTIKATYPAADPYAHHALVPLHGIHYGLACPYPPVLAVQNERAVSLSYSDPWVRDNSLMISQRLELVNSRSPIYATHGPPRDSQQADIQSAYGVHKVVGGGEWAMPIAENCQGRAGIHWQRASCTGPYQDPARQVSSLNMLKYAGITAVCAVYA